MSKTRNKVAEPRLSEQELTAVILGLAEYESSGQREKDEFTYHEVSELRRRLKELANERFQSNWAILENEEDEV